MQIDTTIETPRLILRSLDEDDATEDYLGWLCDPVVLRFLEVRFAGEQSLQSLRNFIVSINGNPDELLLGIFLRESGCHIGNVKLGPIVRQHRRAEIGFLIGDCREWGKGYASEAIDHLTRFAFRTLALDKVTSGCYSKNLGSAKALEKAGYLREACLASHWLCNGEWQDGWMFARRCEGDPL